MPDRRRGPFRVAQRLRPAPPVLAGALLGDRLEGGETLQRGAAIGAERVHLAVAAEGGAGGLQHRALGRPDGGIVHQPGRRQLGKGGRIVRHRGAGHRRIQPAILAGHVDIDRVEEPPVGRVIGAGALAIVGEQRVQRVEPDHRRPGPRRRPGQAGERGEVADALIAGPPHRIEMRRHTEPPPALAQRRRQVAGARGRRSARRRSAARPPATAASDRPAAAAAGPARSGSACRRRRCARRLPRQ